MCFSSFAWAAPRSRPLRILRKRSSARCASLQASTRRPGRRSGQSHPSEFPNYDAVKLTFTKGTRKDEYDFLLSKDGKTLFKLTKLDLTKDPYAELMKKIDVKGRPTRGIKTPKSWSSTMTTSSARSARACTRPCSPALLKEYGDRVVFIYKDFPLAEIHPWATHAAVNANCLAAQNR